MLFVSGVLVSAGFISLMQNHVISYPGCSQEDAGHEFEYSVAVTVHRLWAGENGGYRPSNDGQG
jgi:hypothetical protein